MNKTVTSREEILKVSRKLLKEQNGAALNIRTVASACGVSVGSIYNYFHSKAELTAAAVESIWNDIFCFPEKEDGFVSFTDCVAWIFACMKKGSESYPGFFMLHSTIFPGEEKEDGKDRMLHSWKRIQDELHEALRRDRKVRRETFDETFTPEKFSGIIFSLIIAAMLRQDYDCSGVLEMIKRILY